MDMVVTQRRHNPVDSICRKLQTIQRRDQEANSPFQIPKFQSSSYDSPQSGLRGNLEAILKKRTVARCESECASPGVPTPACPLGPRQAPRGAPSVTPANCTYTTATLGERRATGPGHGRAWQRSCSTPAAQTVDRGFSFSRFPAYPQSDGAALGGERHKSPMRGLMAYNLNFCSSDTSGLLDCELGYPALVVKRLSMGEGALFTSEPKKESMSEVSLICEEDLLDTIFHACDTQRRGKVYVSRIVDYLRHTTSRSSEDSGLEELCNMLDPERKDVSIDLDTYHAIMKEWIEDCRNQGDDTPEDLTQESVKLRDSLSAKRSALLNMTSGSLEAFGGEASRGDLETSDLVYCVADLQFNNQKLQEEARKLKQAVETMEDTNQKLIEENEDLKSKARVGQQLAQNEKLLKEEVEEMKMSLSSSEEGRARAATQSKHLARENQALIAKIASLQEENIKVTVDMDDLQKKMIELCDLNADLQVQIHSCDAVMAEKASVIRERNGQIAELRSAIEEYSSVTELLRADKTKLENQMQMMQPDVAAAAGLSLSAAYRLNQSSSGSLQTELALAQSPLEGAERAASSICFASPLDVTLDREVLLLLQGPSPEQMSLEFKSLISKLNREFKEDSLTVLSALRGLPETHNRRVTSTDQRLQGLQAELQQRRMEWARGLEQLDLYTGSLEKELLKMASNMRRSRTEILHLSVRVQEQENQKQQLREELDQLKTPQDSREASCQTPDNQLQDLDAPLLEWDEEYVLPESPPDNDGPRELRSDEELLRDFGCEEEELQGLREEEEEPLVSGRPGLGSGGGVQKQGSNGEGEGQQDSGVEEEELRGDSTLSQKTTLEQGSDREGLESSDIPEGALREMSGSLEQEEARLPGCTGPAHGQAVQREQSEPGLQPRPHTQLAEALTLDPIEAHPQNQMLSPSDTPPVLDETISLTGRSPQPAAGAGGAAEDLAATAGMTDTQKLSQDQLVDPSAALERSNLLPVAEEEEPMQEAGQVPTVEVDTTGTDAAPGLDSPRTDAPGDPSDDAKDAANLEPGSADEGLGGQPRKDPLMLRSVFKKELELSRSVEATEEHKAMGHKDACTATEKEGDGSVIAEDANDSTKEERNSLSPSDKEIETEFHRLSLGFKCDIFTLEKRLRLEERSRDLAEENVRREVSSCQGLLQALIPLCEDDNQSMEIIQRLQKNLDILIQSMTRVSSRSEMLGAIHQESRIGKAVEVMVQHVENLRRMYTKEHAELLELRETLMQNERSFGSHPHDRGDEFRNKKQTGSQYYKASVRRVSIAAIPRSSGGPVHFDIPKSQDSMETEVERLSRRAPWNLTGKSSQRPPLKRFVSSGAWAGAETDDPLPMNRYGNDTDSPSEEERREEPAERKSSLTELGNKITSLIMPLKTLSTSPSPSEPAVRYLTVGRPVGWSGARGLWVWVALVVVLAVLLALLASLVLQPAVDAAPVGTGDSWMTIQQLLWPYTGLRHNGQPPV